MLCQNCWRAVIFSSDIACIICGLPFNFKINTESICAACIQTKPFFDHSISMFRYDENSKGIIHQFKYSDATHIARTLAMLMHHRFNNKLKGYDFIVPVPMHRLKLNKRLFNQSALLAKCLSKYINIEFAPNMLVKAKQTLQQTGLNQKQRLSNVAGSFKINPKFKSKIYNKRILLIDDVYTTGSTLNECSKVMKKAQCLHVTTLTIARVMN